MLIDEFVREAIFKLYLSLPLLVVNSTAHGTSKDAEDRHCYLCRFLYSLTPLLLKSYLTASCSYSSKYRYALLMIGNHVLCPVLAVTLQHRLSILSYISF